MAFPEKVLHNTGTDWIKQGCSCALLPGERYVWAKMDVVLPLSERGWLHHERKDYQPVQLSDCAATLASPGHDGGDYLIAPCFNMLREVNTSRAKCCCHVVPSWLMRAEGALIVALGNAAAPSYYQSLHGTRSAGTNPKEIFKRQPQRYSRRKR